MRIVHLSDLHLGYRAYHRTDERGINIREADVARAFRQALDRTIELAPDLVLIAGDVFHTVRPSNAAIADAFRQFAGFTAELPHPRVVIVAGNHDSPRSIETGSILRLFAEIPGIHVVHHDPKRLSFPELGASVLCLPHNSLVTQEGRPAIEPDPAAIHNVLLLHGDYHYDRDKLVLDFGTAPLRRDEVAFRDWTYVALGSYHIRERFAPNMHYAGAIERTSLNIWAEADDARPSGKKNRRDPWPRAPWGKGLIEFDADEETARFHVLDGLRPVLDLEPIFASDGPAPADLDRLIEERLAAVKGGIEGKVIRLLIFDLPREIYRELDHRRIKEYRTLALHFHLDARPPRRVRHAASGAPGRHLTLQEELVSFVRNRWEGAADEKERERLIELGSSYLRDAEEVETAEGT